MVPLSLNINAPFELDIMFAPNSNPPILPSVAFIEPSR